MELKKDLDEIVKEVSQDEELDKKEQPTTIIEENSNQKQAVVGELTVSKKDNFEMQTSNNTFISAMANNETAIEMAKESYAALKNQKKISKDIEDVVKQNTKTDIESARIIVQEKDKNNKVKKAEIRNELLRLENERVFLKKERKHKLEMQRAQQIRDKYEDLLLRTCRKKQKGEDGKWHYVVDENGKDVVNIPGKFKLFWLKLFDGIISTLNQTAEIFGALNKNVIKGGFIILILALLFIPPFRSWLLGLIGIKLG